MRTLNKRQQRMLASVRDRFIEERTKGYLTPGGQHYAPISREDAERAWDAQDTTQWENALFDPQVIEKLGLAKDEPIPAEWIKPVEAHQSSKEAHNAGRGAAAPPHQEKIQ